MVNIYRALLISMFFCNLQAVDIAITIDDYPMPNSSLLSFQKRMDLFLQTCSQSGYKIAFFCLGSEFKKQEKSYLYLNLLDKQGHFLCNHSMTHSFLSSQSLEALQQEIIKTEQILKPYKNMKKWFRYPYLDYGDLSNRGGSIEKATQAQKMLSQLGYVEGYVTLNTFDFHINARLQQAIKRGDKINYDKLKTIYVNLIKEWCEDYINYYSAEGHKNITHTLLLHANDINALYLSDILKMICKSGWNIVSPELAFKDTSWRTSISEILKWRNHKPLTMNYESIDARLQDAKVFSALPLS